jgi:CRP-like cAMP-binding protein
MESPFIELKQIAIANSLRRCELFHEPLNADLNSIAACTISKTLEKGDFLFREGDPAYAFYVVQRGAISVHRIGCSGKEQVLHIFRQSEIVAEETVFTDTGYQTNARAIEQSQVLMVPKAEFLGTMRRYPDLALRMLKVMSGYFNSLLDTLESLRLKDVRTRVSDWLINQCPNPSSKQPWQIELRITKRMLASELGIASETFSRILRKLQREKLLSVDGKYLTLLNPERLALTLDKKVDLIPEGWTSMQNRGTKVNDLFGNTPKAAVARA